MLAWFKNQGGQSVPMSAAIGFFRDRIMGAGERREDNQKLFLYWVQALTVSEPGKKLRLKDEAGR